MDSIFLFGDAPSCGAAKSFFKILKQREEETPSFTWNGGDIIPSQITRLSFVHLRLRDIAILTRAFECVIYLNLSFNKIVNILPLQKLVNLSTLDISHNKITEIDSLTDLIKLKILRIHDNDISNLSPLNDHQELHRLWASNNSIPWESAIHLSTLSNLGTLFLEDNPCEEKDRFEDFLFAILPTLRLYNGKQVKIAETRHADFLKSVIGRQMITQARATMSSSQRQALDLTNSTSASDKNCHPPLAQKLLGGGRRTTMPERLNASSATVSEDSSTTPRYKSILVSEEEPSPGQVAGSFNSPSETGGVSAASESKASASSNSSRRGANSREQENRGKRLKDNKKRNTKDDDKGINEIVRSPDRYTTIGEAGAVLEEQENNNSESTSPVDDGACYRQQERTFSNKLRKSIEVAATVNKESEPFLVRFEDDGPSAPTAFCLREDRSGYVKWSAYGATACSLENSKKLLCSYKNGAIAAMYDSSCNGSIMDLHGRCVLLLSDRGDATVYDRKGRTVATYQRPAAQTHDDAINTAEDDYYSGGNGNSGSSSVVNSASVSPVKEASTAKNTNNNSSGGKVRGPKGGHKWSFDDMTFSFDPDRWEIIVEIKTERLQCCFSTVAGGRLIKEIHSNSAKKTERQKKDKVELPTLTHDEHETIRSDMKSLASQLDDMLAGIKRLR